MTHHGYTLPRPCSRDPLFPLPHSTAQLNKGLQSGCEDVKLPSVLTRKDKDPMMRPLVVLCCAACLAFTLTPSFAQNAQPPKAEAEPEPVRTTSGGTLVLVTDSPCDVYVDGEQRGCATVGKPLEIKVVPGEHRLEAVGKNGGRWRKRIEIDSTVRRVVEIEDVDRFVPYEDGTVLDARTGLMWASRDNGSDITWHDGKAYCENFRGGGYDDWRMPTLDELEGLYNAKNHHHLIHRTGWVWSSETDGSASAYFGFIYGKRYWHFPSYAHSLRALPVRAANRKIRETGDSAD